MDKKIFAIVLGIIVVGGGSFYAGVKYDKSSSLASVRGVGQARFKGAGSGEEGMMGLRNVSAGSGLVNGEILSKDNESITVRLRDNGSKIVFLSGKTSITKSVDGSPEDLVINKQVSVIGIQNSDGSMTAGSIQIRPNAIKQYQR